MLFVIAASPSNTKIMSTEAQIEANRRNALKSTGPKTSEGKSLVRWNAMRHGIYSPVMLLPGEDKEAFDRLRQSYLELYKPSNQAEFFLVARLILAAWRLTRMAGMEVRVVCQRSRERAEWMKDDANPLPDTDDIAKAYMADCENGRSITAIARYQASLERSYYKALHELEKLKIGSVP